MSQQKHAAHAPHMRGARGEGNGKNTEISMYNIYYSITVRRAYDGAFDAQQWHIRASDFTKKIFVQNYWRKYATTMRQMCQ